jgi:regulator of protease activity HflC (stomatin/prohibitin superfamily)
MAEVEEQTGLVNRAARIPEHPNVPLSQEPETKQTFLPTDVKHVENARVDAEPRYADEGFGILEYIMMAVSGFLAIVLFPLLYGNIIVIVQQYKRMVHYRFGKIFKTSKGPGLFFIFPFIDEVKLVDVRVQQVDFPPQEIITRDGVSCKVNAIVFFFVEDAVRATFKVENIKQQTILNASTTLRSVLGHYELDDMLSKRVLVAERIQKIMHELMSPNGIRVTGVEMFEVALPDNQQRSLASQAESERDRRANIITAEGEQQAAVILSQAANMLTRCHGTAQLRLLDTLTKVSKDNETVVFPLPTELILEASQGDSEGFANILKALLIAEGMGSNDNELRPGPRAMPFPGFNNGMQHMFMPR